MRISPVYSMNTTFGAKTQNKNTYTPSDKTKNGLQEYSQQLLKQLGTKDEYQAKVEKKWCDPARSMIGSTSGNVALYVNDYHNLVNRATAIGSDEGIQSMVNQAEKIYQADIKAAETALKTLKATPESNIRKRFVEVRNDAIQSINNNIYCAIVIPQG